jgi:excisionase family DNA binding protein
MDSISPEPERLWTVHEVSTYLRIPVGTLYQWRHRRIGPPASKTGRHLRYDPNAVREWVRGRAV